MSNYKFLTWNDIQSACDDIAYNIKHSDTLYKIEAVVGLSRGGLIPGVILSHMLNRPFIPLSYSSREGKGDDKNHANSVARIPHKNILLTDDIADSGWTMKEVVNHYKEMETEAITAVIIEKTPNPADFKATFAWKRVNAEYPWIIYPWEHQD